MARCRLLLAEPRHVRRLELIAALRGGFEVLLLEPTEDPLRVVRRERPELVILGCQASQPLAAARTCRALKTELDPPRVGVLNGPGLPLDPKDVMDQYLADGYLGGPADPETVRSWAERLRDGERPVVVAQPARGWWRRLLP